MDFFELLDSAQPYLGCFDYDHYPQCFAEFEANAAEFFRGLEGRDPEAAAESLLNNVAERWNSLPRLKRRAAAKRDKTVLALFFTPAAARHSEAAMAFAAVLRERWNSRFPRNRYLAGDYEKLIKGFDTDFFGITLRKTEHRG